MMDRDTKLIAILRRQYLISYPDLPRSYEGRSGKVRFRARPEIRAFLSLRMFVLTVVILGDFAE